MSPRVPPDKTLSSAASLYTNESTCLIIDLTLHTLSRSRCTGWAAAPREHPWIFRTPRLPGLRESSSSASASWIFFIFSFSPFLFLSFLLAPSSSLLLVTLAKTTRLRTNERAVIGDRLSVFVSPPHRFRFLPPHAVCLFLRLPLWFASPRPSADLSLSLARRRERARTS